MPDVRLPDGRVARFPDDMPREQIKSVIAQKFPNGAGTPNAIPQQDFNARFAGTGGQGGPLDAAVQGLSFGFSDELLGNMAGAYALLRGKGFKTAGQVRDAFTQEQRNRLNEYRQRDLPGAVGWEVAGALPTAAIPVGNLGRVAQGANWLKAAGAAGLEGAAFGSAYGAGTADGGLADRAGGAVAGGLVGGGIGAAANPALRVLGGLAGQVTRPIAGFFNPEAQAAKRIAAAFLRDQQSARPGIQPAQEAIAARNNQVVTNLDRGGETTRNLARAAANISGEGESALRQVIEPRFESQGARVQDALQRLVGGAQTEASREAVKAAARAQNAPAYRQVFARPEAQNLWDGTLQQLTGAPEVADAMRKAAITARTDAARNGFAPIKTPFTQDPATGRMVLANPNVRPNLQFWDQVKRELDKVKTPNSMALARTLRTYLDSLVPDYQAVRSGAAKFFGEEDALNAGYSLLDSRMSNEMLQRGVSKMTAPERKLFGIGYANAIIDKVRRAANNRDVTIGQMFNSAEGKARLEAALGKRGARELEAVIRIESMLDLARKALGNSTTVKQWLAVGGATGAYGGTTGDWKPALAALGAFLTKRGVNAIDVNVMTKVAEKLASRDPKVVQEGIKAAASDERVFNLLRQMTSVGAISQAAPAAMPQ